MSKGKWQAVGKLHTAGADRPWTRRRLRRCDPYLVWSDATTAAGPHEDLDIAVLVELSAAGDLPEFAKRMNLQASDVTDLLFLPNGFEPAAPTRFITGLVDGAGLAALIDEVLAGTIERFSLQNSRRDIARTAKAMWRESREPNKEPAPADAPGGPGTYLGIIDDGLPVLRLRDAVQLVKLPAHFWDQGWQPTYLLGAQVKPAPVPAPDDPYWRVAWEFLITFAPDPATGALLPRVQPPRGFLYGRRLKPLPASSAGTSDRDEYFLSGYFTPAPRHTHGAGVLGLLAPWVSAAHSLPQWPPHIGGLAMVQLPTTTVLDTSGGSLAMRVIDGLRYILWQESQDRPRPAATDCIVANVSYGVHAGPHDGTSMFERALAEMLDANPRLHVVLPAGNAGQVGCHAARLLAPKGEPGHAATIALQVLPDNGRDTFVEVWLPPGADVELRIRPPGSTTAYAIRPGEAKVHFDPHPDDPSLPLQVHFGAVYAPEVAQGTTGTMVLLAIGATRCGPRPADEPARGLNQQPRLDVRGAPGLWELTVRNRATEAVAVNAWVERDDAPPDLPGGSRQAYFPDTCTETVRRANATPESTLNGIATLQHRQLHVVGAMRADGPLSAYSAAGPALPPSTRREPDAVAPADASGAVAGLRTTGFVRGVTARINGTSAACAVYARALAEQLAYDPSHLPGADPPPDAPPEITCTSDSMPEADPSLRGYGRRQLFPFDVDL